MTPLRCKSCGVSEWRHVCAGLIPLGDGSRVTRGVAPAAKAGVSNAVSNAAAERVRKWRGNGPNRAKYNEQQRERMRARRAARKAT